MRRRPADLGRPPGRHDGIPAGAALFRGTRAETCTPIPVVSELTDGLIAKDLVAVTDVGMLSAVNLAAREDAEPAVHCRISDLESAP